jgi:cell division control protein 24
MYVSRSCCPRAPALQVVNTVTAIVNYLPPDAFEGFMPASPMSRRLPALRDNPTGNSKPALPTKTQENIIREMVETERKFGKDIELMHVCFLLDLA